MFRNLFDKGRYTITTAYYPEIDGLRAIAVLWVMLMHLFDYLVGKNYLQVASIHPALHHFFKNGGLGVNIFYVISGFVITVPFARNYLLKKNVLRIETFYLRRFYRIAPPYYIFMSVMLIAYLIQSPGSAVFYLKSFFASLFFIHNYVFQQPPFLFSGAWTIEVEMHFYLLAPLMMQVFRLSAPIRRTLMIVFCVLISWLQTVYNPGYISIYSCIQYFMAGILLADFFVSGWKKEVDSFTNAGLTLLFLASWGLLIWQPVDQTFLKLLFVLALVSLFCFAVIRSPFLKKIFANRYLAFIGAMSYSLYLLHYAIISVFGRVTLHFLTTANVYLRLLFQLTTLSACVLVVTFFFFIYVDRYFMKINPFKKKEF